MTGNIVIIPMKPPMIGKVKTRLAEKIGDLNCVKLSKYMLLDMLDAHSNQNAYDVQVITEDTSVHDFELSMPEIMVSSFTPTKHGHREFLLREAFFHYHKNYSKVICLFADAPFVFQDKVMNALNALNEHDVVIGSDGGPGYYLIGTNQPVDIFSPFASIERSPYFQGTIDLSRSMKLKIAFTEKQQDIDTIDDINSIDWANYINNRWNRTRDFLFQLGLIDV